MRLVTGNPYPYPYKPVPVLTGTGSHGYGFTRVWVRVRVELPMGYPCHALFSICGGRREDTNHEMTCRFVPVVSITACVVGRRKDAKHKITPLVWFCAWHEGVCGGQRNKPTTKRHQRGCRSCSACVGGQRKDTKHEITPWLVWFYAWHVVDRRACVGGQRKVVDHERRCCSCLACVGDKKNAETKITPMAV